MDILDDSIKRRTLDNNESAVGAGEEQFKRYRTGKNEINVLIISNKAFLFLRS